MHIAKIDPRAYLSQKRALKQRKTRAHLARRRRSQARAAAWSQAKRAQFGARSQVLAMMAAAGSAMLPMSYPRLRVPMPREFSMVDDPAATLNVLSAFARAYQQRPLASVFCDFQAIKMQDLAAHALLGKLADEVFTDAGYRNLKIRFEGNFPADPAHKRLVQATGIIKDLRVQSAYLGAKEAQTLTLYERHCRSYVRSLRPQSADEKARASRRFADHLNKCLHEGQLELTELAQHHLCECVGELLDNAERHAGMVDWTIKGYLDPTVSDGMCEIAIFNFGKPISQTLDELPAESFTRRQIQPYLDAHEVGGLFTRNWRREDLLTVIALQRGVSSKNDEQKSTYGHGTADLIEFFMGIHDDTKANDASKVRMSLISGGTRIIFDGTHRISAAAEDGPKIIAFNAANDLRQPPDRAYVMPLQDVVMPGTLITIKFPVPRSILKPADGATP